MRFEPIEGVKVIGIGHKARHGKDTAARAIVAASGGRARQYACADDLRAVARVEHGMTEKDPALLQRLGTEHYRAKDPDVWIRSLYFRLREDRPEIAVISDVRFPNEVAFVRDLGGQTVKVQRVNEDGSPFVDPSRSATHASEIALDGFRWDWIVRHKTGDPQTLVRGARMVLEHVTGVKRQPVVYVAGPFRAASAYVAGGQDMFRVQENIMRAMALSVEAWRLGAVALCPHANTMFFTGAADDRVWLDGDLELLRRSDAVLLTDNWQTSSGARHEVDVARAAGIPVFETLDALRAFLGHAGQAGRAA